MMECISRDGIATMRRASRRNTVVWSASPRAVGFRVFAISHKISSARTAASATVVENVNAERRLIGPLAEDSESRSPILKVFRKDGDPLRPPLRAVLPERIGNSL